MYSQIQKYEVYTVCENEGIRLNRNCKAQCTLRESEGKAPKKIFLFAQKLQKCCNFENNRDVKNYRIYSKLSKVPFNSLDSQINLIQSYINLFKDLKDLSPTLVGSKIAFCLNSQSPAFLSVDCARNEDKEDFKTELEIMKRVKAHPNVVRLLGCCTVKGYF